MVITSKRYKKEILTFMFVICSKSSARFESFQLCQAIRMTPQFGCRKQNRHKRFESLFGGSRSTAIFEL